MKRAPEGLCCPACGGRQFRTVFETGDRLYGTTDKRFHVVECAGCELMRMHPWPPPDELRTYYPENYWFSAGESTPARLEEQYRRLVLRDHVQFVRSALRRIPQGPVLDVGCGGALFGRMLRESGVNAMGLDFSVDAARVGWSVNGVPVAVGDFSNAPLRPGTFAAVTMFHVLEHLYEPSAFLEAAARYLRPDGVLIVQVPNAACWQFLLLGEAWNGIDVPRHLIDFKARDMDALLRHCGFEPVRHKYFSLRDNPAGLASSLAPSLDPMARRIRKTGESPRARLMKDVLYLGLVAASVPFTLLEAACRAGSTVMIEARRKPA